MRYLKEHKRVYLATPTEIKVLKKQHDVKTLEELNAFFPFEIKEWEYIKSTKNWRSP